MKNKNWIVIVECTVKKEVCVANCTEEEARNNPFDHSEDEREIEQSDYRVISVEPNE